MIGTPTQINSGAAGASRSTDGGISVLSGALKTPPRAVKLQLWRAGRFDRHAASSQPSSSSMLPRGLDLSSAAHSPPKLVTEKWDRKVDGACKEK